ncbi:tRNA-splicing endonuclease subunit Sen54 isoform X2 [Latimeria chalumnae]|uniref:tRNA-splicing endonuclease subunit Sen54 isoform X2 n=1 Tax=Latimeria chalumnae TaxID=7897 RepID=UPI00313EB492
MLLGLVCYRKEKKMAEKEKFSDVEVRAGRVLSPAELFAARSREQKLPQRSHGQKDFIPDNSEKQAEKLHVCREEQWQLLSEERVERLSSLVKAEWKPRDRVVELKSPAGKFWHTMGHVSKGKQLLHPEEALYLLECGSVQIFYRDLPLSVQEAFERLLSPKTISLQQYQVYGHLKRLGYVVTRFELCMASLYERRLNLDSWSRGSQRHHGKRKRSPSPRSKRDRKSEKPCTLEHSSEDAASCKVKQAKTSIPNMSLDKGAEMLDKTPEESFQEVTVNEYAVVHESRHRKLGSEVVGEPQKVSGCFTTDSLRHAQKSPKKGLRLRWDFTKIRFPNVASDCPHTALVAPKECLLPGDIVGRDSDASAWCQKINQKQEKLSRKERELLEKKSKYKTNINKDKRVKQCSNWKEFKELTKKSWDEKELLPHLWKDVVSPLFKMGQAASPGDLLQQISILKSSCILDEAARLQKDPGCVKIDFDVYQADVVAEFKKTCPGKPYVRICVCRFDMPVPDLRTIKMLAYQSGDVPVVFAVVDSGDLSFYSLKDFKLPTDVYH